MTIVTMEVFEALVQAGVPKAQAEAAAHAIITRQEAKQILATKEDLAVMREDFLNLRSELYRAMMIQTGAIVTILGGLISVLAIFS